MNHMWQDLKKSGGYWEAPGLPHQANMGRLSEDLHMCFPRLPARTDKEKNKYVPILPSLLGAQVLEPRGVMRKWVCHEESILCREKESFDWR